MGSARHDVTDWTCVSAVVAGLHRQGLNLIAPGDQQEIDTQLRAAGFAVKVARGGSDRGATIAAICAALGLPRARNLDAFADVLADLRSDGGRLVLIWEAGELLLQADLDSWLQLVEILTTASIEHWDLDDEASPDNLVFESLVVVDGFGVKALV